MALENLRDRIIETWSELVHRVTDSPTYNNLREKYETLPPNTQRGLIVGLIGLGLIILFSFPLGYFNSSITQNEEYESNRDLLRKLLYASSIAKDISSTPSFPSLEDIKARVMTELTTMNLQTEQIGGVAEITADSMGGVMASRPISQSGLGLTLKKLNLSQIVDLAFTLQQMHPAVKLGGLDIRAQSADPHYFDVVYKLAVFDQAGLASSPRGQDQNAKQPQNKTPNSSEEVEAGEE